jgi:predicted nucleic acid-binding protein
VITAVAVSDASPLITLDQIDRLELLRDLFSDVVVPPAVALEVAPSVQTLPLWVREVQAPSLRDLASHRGAGEREAIALAVHLTADSIVIDDLTGRRIAASLGLTMIGTLGLLVRAKRSGLLRAVRPEMDALIASGLYVSEQVYHNILGAAGESIR